MPCGSVCKRRLKRNRPWRRTAVTIHKNVDADAIEKLIRLIEDKRLTTFDDEEAAALKAIAAYWMGLRSVGRIATWFRSVIMWFGWLVLLWLAIKTGALEWLHGATR